MKYNNFLIALALFVGFSSIQMNASETKKPTPPSSGWGWGSWRPSMPTWSSVKERVNSAYESMTQTMSSWGVTKLRATFIAAASALLAGYVNRDTLIDMIRNIPQQPAYKMAQGAFQSAAPYVTAQNALRAGMAAGAVGFGYVVATPGRQVASRCADIAFNEYVINSKNGMERQRIYNAIKEQFGEITPQLQVKMKNVENAIKNEFYLFGQQYYQIAEKFTHKHQEKPFSFPAREQAGSDCAAHIKDNLKSSNPAVDLSIKENIRLSHRVVNLILQAKAKTNDSEEQQLFDIYFNASQELVNK